jgi:hypothetical protein
MTQPPWDEPEPLPDDVLERIRRQLIPGRYDLTVTRLYPDARLLLVEVFRLREVEQRLHARIRQLESGGFR